MSQALAKLDPSPAWSIRLFGTLPLPIVGTGFVVFAVWCIFALAYSAVVLGESEHGASAYSAFELLNAAVIAFAPTATAWLIVSASRDLQALRPALDLDDSAFDETERRTTAFSRRYLALASLIGIAGMLIGVFSPDPNDPVVWPDGRPALTSGSMVWILLRGGVLWGLLARTIYVDLALARRFSRLGETVNRVDVLDAAPLAPFAARGLRSVLLWMIVIFLNSLFLLIPFAKSTAAFNLIGMIVLAITLLFLPVRGIHRRMRDARRDELARVRAAIRDERGTVLDNARGPEGGHGRLADLIAYEGRVAHAATWPFDVGTWLRFGLYVAVGTGSWLGAALVERVVDRALG